MDDIVKRLREAPNDWPDADLHYEAANAIEKLSKENETLAKTVKAGSEILRKSRPVVRGRWISHDFVAMGKGRYTWSVECSTCGRFLPLPENFCPNCGADMMEGS